jgi:diguanylate cyclase (GGDEF)-like protein/PAS domain S-box-containing protein
MTDTDGSTELPVAVRAHRGAPLPPDEDQRLRALRDLDQLDSAPEPVFDAITRLAASLCDVPIALVRLVDERRQWFKSAVGLAVKETPRELAFCAHAILTPTELLEVPDTTQDARFRDNPLVLQDPHIRFYAGAPLVNRDGLGLGTLCAMDRVPRTLTPEQRGQLRDLATLVVHVLETTRTARALARVTTDLGRAEQRFRLLFGNAPIGMTLAGMDRHYLSANKPFYDLVGYSESELRELTFTDLTHPDDRLGDDQLARQLVSGVLSTVRRRKRYVRRDGVAVHVDVHASIMRDDGGAPLGFISQVIDTTAERQAETRLRDAKALLRSLIESVPDAIMSVDRDGLLTAFNSHVAEDIRRNYGVKIERGTRLFDIGDEQTRTVAMENHRRCLQGESLHFEWSLPAGGGGPRHLMMSHTPMVANDAVFGAAIMVKDITARREMELSILRKNRDLDLIRSIATTANESLTSPDALAHILELVATFGGWAVGHALSLVGDRLESQKIWYLRDPGWFAPFRDASEKVTFSPSVGLPGQVLASKRPAWMASLPNNPEFSRSSVAGELQLFSGFAFPVFVGSEVVAVLEFFSERDEGPHDELDELFQSVGRQVGRIIERERHVAQVRALALIDELTTLHNRRGFMTLARHQLRIIARSKNPNVLLFADLDGLKRINDVLGHEAGDQAIVSFASVLRRTFRGEDIAARLGGDEFVVWMNTSSANASAALARLQHNLDGVNASRPPSAPLAASIGVLELPPNTTESLEAILVRADALMYEQKRARHARRQAPAAPRAELVEFLPFDPITYGRF